MKCVVALAMALTAQAIDIGSDEEPTKGPTAMEESDSAGRAGLAVAAAAAVAYVL